MPQINLEIPIFSPSSASSALSHGATRLELNAPGSYPAGGLTPPLSALASLLSSSSSSRSLPIDAMLASIRHFKASGLLDPSRGDGFVFGILRPSSSSSSAAVVLDSDANARLVTEAKPFGCTFTAPSTPSSPDHIDALLACGFDAVLTSGGPGNASDNLARLGDLIRAAAGRLDVLIGGGVRASGAAALLEAAGAANRVWLHSSCIGAGETDEVDAGEVAALVEVIGEAVLGSKQG
ncbi:unnamed protein product [Parascedosporium putredinis]|uniref:Copper homeostasis protein cutC homolog n=1 Tax=Parascedosporium putredinis TaxID=1442378 RepID=A0A9P1M5S3_9PEZI|nr:unnamed protein product [Parascedosporium putredinis]CAI7988381.1 unnamed protein product [Parascedosporium putredinis]